MPLKLISAALFGTSWYGNNYDPDLHNHVDWLGLMTYDFTGSWNASPVGPHSALYKIKDQSRYSSEQQGNWPGGGLDNNPITSVEDALWYWTNPFYVNWQGSGAKIPRSKVALGVPTYGYDFAYGKKPDDMSGQIPPGYQVIRYKDLLTNFPNAASSSDGLIQVKGSTTRPSFVKASGSYGYKNNIYFETQAMAVAKQSFAKTLGCQGVIVWELTNDVSGPNSILDRL
jgi:GH18 family chitinase